MRPTAISAHRNHKRQFLISPPYPKQVLTSPLAAIIFFLISPLIIIIVPKFAILLFTNDKVGAGWTVYRENILLKKKVYNWGGGILLFRQN